VAVLESDSAAAAAVDTSSNDNALRSIQADDAAIIAQEPAAESAPPADGQADDTTPDGGVFAAPEAVVAATSFGVTDKAAPETAAAGEVAESGSDADVRPTPARAPKSPRQYRPPRSTPPRPTGTRTPRVELAAMRDLRLDVSVRLVFEYGGFCRLSLIP